MKTDVANIVKESIDCRCHLVNIKVAFIHITFVVSIVTN